MGMGRELRTFFRSLSVTCRAGDVIPAVQAYWDVSHFISDLDEAKNRENERIRFAKRNEGFRIDDGKSLKSLWGANHEFRGSICF
jgi:hypothetical protein